MGTVLPGSSEHFFCHLWREAPRFHNIYFWKFLELSIATSPREGHIVFFLESLLSAVGPAASERAAPDPLAASRRSLSLRRRCHL